MEKRLKRLLANKGMTLVELIVAMFLTTVILAIALGMLVSTKNLMNTMKSNAHMDTISSTVDEYIRGTLQTARSLQIFKLEKSDNDFSVFEEDITKLVPEDGSNEVNALAILNTGTDDDPPVYRIYDLGKINSFSEIISDIDLTKTKPNRPEDDFRVFYEAFYEDTSCAVEFYKSDKIIQVASQCHKNGEAINQKHTLSFNLLNGAVTEFKAVDGTNEKTSLNYTEQLTGHCYLILYTLP